MNDRKPQPSHPRMPWGLGALALLALATSGAAQAQQTRSFVSCVDDRWETPNCWSPSGVPGSLDTALIGGNRTAVLVSTTAVSRTEVTDAILQIFGGTLTTGTLAVNGGGLVGVTGSVNISQLALNSAGGEIVVLSPGIFDLGPAGGLANRGVLTLRGGTVNGGNANLANFGQVGVAFQSTIASAQFSQSGSLTVAGQSTLTVSSALFVNSGTITLNSSPTSPVALQGNTLRHDGWLLTGGGRVNNPIIVGGGAISPGAGQDLILQGAVQFDRPAPIQVDGPAGGRLFFQGDTRFGGSNFHQITGGGRTEFGQELQLGPDVPVPVRLSAIGTVALQSGSNLFMRLAADGTADSMVVSDGLFLQGGTLTFTSLDGNALGIGNSFTLFPQTTLSGNFGNISFVELPLAAGANLDFSQLYTNGTLSVVAVPEPGTWLMLMAGLAGLGAVTRARRRPVAVPA